MKFGAAAKRGGAAAAATKPAGAAAAASTASAHKRVVTWGCNVNGALGRERAVLGESRGPEVEVPREMAAWPGAGDDVRDEPAAVSCGWGHTAVVT